MKSIENAQSLVFLDSKTNPIEIDIINKQRVSSKNKQKRMKQSVESQSK
jgi:hypothetical protein